MNHIETFFAESAKICDLIDKRQILELVFDLIELRSNSGRLFVLGVGGSAANAEHMTADLRKLCGLECYCPTSSVAELTARTNDDQWAATFDEWLKVSKLSNKDAIFVLSVGGGSIDPIVSPNIVRAVGYAKEIGAKVFGIVGRKEGYTAKYGDNVIIIPTVNGNHITQHSEAFQLVILHALVSHPNLQTNNTKW